MAAFTKIALTAAAQTGNNTHTGVLVPDEGATKVAVEFVVEAIGATPTATFILHGSMDNVNWDATFTSSAGIPLLPAVSDTVTAAGIAKTTVGSFVYHVSNFPSREWRYYRVQVSANTNVTYSANLWVGSNG